MNIEKILPKDGPSIEEVKKYIEKYSNEIIVIKCGGSVLLDKNLFNQFIEDISIVNKLGLSSIVTNNILTMAQQVVIMKRTTVKTTVK